MNARGRHPMWRYGLLGLPLAFVALPLYVLLPNHYARSFGVPLASLGALLLGARLFDALIDPLLGRWVDRLFGAGDLANAAQVPLRTGAPRVLRFAFVACALLALGFILLFFPPVRGNALLVWAALCLLLTYSAYSAVSVAHQSWGARLGGDAVQRSRIVAWREGLGLLGVLLAAVLPLLGGLLLSTSVFCLSLALACWAWAYAQQPSEALAYAQQNQQAVTQATQPCAQTAAALAHASSALAAPSARPSAALTLPFSRPAFRRLLAVFVLNGIASAIPATLVLFFVQDRLQAPATSESIFLALYFAAAALSMPLWLRAVARLGLERVWLAGMLLAVGVFAFASQLGAGDSTAFALVCVLSGAALGGDLLVPGALLTGVIQRAGDAGHAEGAYLGWWNFATKLNLALAAGLALPLLQAFGYSPGARSAEALQALMLAYCALPCTLKLIASYALFTHPVEGNLV